MGWCGGNEARTNYAAKHGQHFRHGWERQGWPRLI
jgi:hypothetical protein